MILSIGTFLQLVFLCVEKNYHGKETVFNAFFDPFGLRLDKTAISRIMRCHVNITDAKITDIRNSLENKLGEYELKIWKEVFPMLDKNKAIAFLLALDHLIESDDTLNNDTPLNIGEKGIKTLGSIRFDSQKPIEVSFSEKQVDEYGKFVVDVFLHALLNRPNKAGKDCLKNLDESYIEAFCGNVTISPMAAQYVKQMDTNVRDFSDLLDCMIFQGFSGRMGRHTLMALAHQGNPFACFEIGELYYHGYIQESIYGEAAGKTRNYEKAYEWYSKATEKHPHAGALWTMAYMIISNRYPHVEETEIDYGKAVEFLVIAAQKNSPAALNTIGQLWEEGHYPCENFRDSRECYPADLGKAKKYYEAAAKKGYHYAANRLALMCEKKNNFEEAFQWYRKAADMVADAYTYNKLGLMYERGIGCRKNLKLASDYYYKSVNQVLPDDITPWALFNAGRVYCGRLGDYETGHFDLPHAWKLFIAAMKKLPAEKHDQILKTMLDVLFQEAAGGDKEMLHDLYGKLLFWLQNYLRNVNGVEADEIKMQAVMLEKVLSQPIQ